MAIEIVLLGTGSPLPDPNRAGPSTMVRVGETTVLVDAGRGVVSRLAGAGVLAIGLDAVLLTHLHSDHISDLNDVITSRWVMSFSPNPLRIFGPRGTANVVNAALAMLEPDISYRLAHHEDLNFRPDPIVTELDAGDTVSIGEATVRCGATNHRPVAPTLAYRIEGEGHSVVAAGDGVPCSSLDELLLGADCYIQTAIRADLVAQVPNARFKDILDYHSSVEQAADTAQRAGVGTLVLTHYVPAPSLGQYEEWIALAAEFSGRVVCGDDLTRIEI